MLSNEFMKDDDFIKSDEFKSFLTRLKQNQLRQNLIIEEGNVEKKEEIIKEL